MNFVALYINDADGTKHTLEGETFVTGKGMAVDIHADTLSAAVDLAIINKPEGYHLHGLEPRTDK